jgi:mannobiose 2-epimerase
MEAYTELYSVWKDEKLKKQLTGLLELIRDVQTHPKGYLQLFFEKDWTPVSFRNASKEEREKNYQLDHVSFGHDYETAFLMLEASFTLGLKDDIKTLKLAKHMLDHALANGWDKDSAGFFDEGYYFEENGKCEIIKDTKNWWAQAEGLNALLLFSKIFPEEKRYFELFLRQWEYVKENLIDQELGGWYWGSIEKEPGSKFGSKSSIWQGTYHNGRALMNCMVMLADDEQIESVFKGSIKHLKEENDEFINHWKETAKKI